MLITKQYFSGSRKTSALADLFQVIGGGPKAVLKLSESCQLTGPKGVHGGWEVHTVWSGRKTLTTSFRFLDVLCFRAEAATLQAHSPNPLWNGGRRGQVVQFKQLNVFTLSGVNRKVLFLTLLLARGLSQQCRWLTSTIPPQASILRCAEPWDKLGLQAKQKQRSWKWKHFISAGLALSSLSVTCSGFFPAIAPPCFWRCDVRFHDSSAPLLQGPTRGDLCSQMCYVPDSFIPAVCGAELVL